MKKVYEFVISKEEYKDFLKNTFLASSLTLGLFLFAMFISVSFLGVLSGSPLMIPVAFIIFLLIMLYNIRNNYVKGMKNFTLSGLNERKITYIFEDKSLKIVTENTSNNVKYKSFYKIKETSLSILFYVNKESAFILPKRLIEENELTEIKQFAESNFKNKSIKWL